MSSKLSQMLDLMHSMLGILSNCLGASVFHHIIKAERVFVMKTGFVELHEYMFVIMNMCSLHSNNLVLFLFVEAYFS